MPITSELLQVFLRWMIKSVHSCIARYGHGVNKFYDKPITDRRRFFTTFLGICFISLGFLKFKKVEDFFRENQPDFFCGKSHGVRGPESIGYVLAAPLGQKSPNLMPPV